MAVGGASLLAFEVTLEACQAAGQWRWLLSLLKDMEEVPRSC